LPKEIPAEGYVFGSGLIEKLQGTLFGYRMKKQGKSCSTKGAYYMSELLSQWYNSEECAEVLENLYQQKLLWDEENERLESGGNWLNDCGCGKKGSLFRLSTLNCPSFPGQKRHPDVSNLAGIKIIQMPGILKGGEV